MTFAEGVKQRLVRSVDETVSLFLNPFCVGSGGAVRFDMCRLKLLRSGGVFLVAAGVAVFFPYNMP